MGIRRVDCRTLPGMRDPPYWPTVTHVDKEWIFSSKRFFEPLAVGQWTTGAFKHLVRVICKGFLTWWHNKVAYCSPRVACHSPIFCGHIRRSLEPMLCTCETVVQIPTLIYQQSCVLYVIIWHADVKAITYLVVKVISLGVILCSLTGRYSEHDGTLLRYSPICT